MRRPIEFIRGMHHSAGVIRLDGHLRSLRLREVEVGVTAAEPVEVDEGDGAKREV